jgi:hypothetical protein
MTEQLPAMLFNTTLTTIAKTTSMPSLIANEGDAAGWRYVEFFAASIRIRTHVAPTLAHAAGSPPGTHIAASRSQPSGHSPCPLD